MNENPVGIVLGTGLGAFADTLESPFEWPSTTVEGHPAKLVTGTVGARHVIVLAGRAHLYEGYSAAQVVLGIHELARRGAKSVILTNAAGGIHLTYRPGDLVLISDHINLTGVNPLTGPNDETLGPRFPDMTEIYSAQYRELAHKAAAGLGIKLQEGVYAGLLGPSYETPAEIRYLRTIGADLVGMSTTLEAIAAAHLGIQVLGISCVTNMAAGILPRKLVHEEVLAVAGRVQKTMIKLLTAVVPRLR
jgi:purine-nucleoside phosphorylase